MNLKQRFEKLDDNIKLDEAVRQSAQEVHNRLGALVVQAGVAKRTRLQGSFARATMLGPKLRDIDKVVEFDDKWWVDLQGPGGPQKAISLVQDALAPHLPGARFEAKKHALAITLPGNGFNFDAVPAFNPEDGSNWIHIADTGDDRWELSNTYILIDTISVRNQQCDGKFVRQVRMVKQAVRKAGTVRRAPRPARRDVHLLRSDRRCRSRRCCRGHADEGCRTPRHGVRRPHRHRPDFHPTLVDGHREGEERDATARWSSRRSTAARDSWQRGCRGSHLGRHLRRTVPPPTGR